MNRMKAKIGTAIIGVIALLQFGHATTMVQMDVRSLTGHSNLIAIGRIAELNTVQLEHQTWTVATVYVERALKGKPANVIYFQVPGGTRTVNGRTFVTVVDGIPQINPQQKVVLFLNGKAPQYYELTGWEQGYWHIQNQNGQEVVSRSAEQPNEKKMLPLRGFVDQIRQMMKEESR